MGTGIVHLASPPQPRRPQLLVKHVASGVDANASFPKRRHATIDGHASLHMVMITIWPYQLQPENPRTSS